MNSVAEFVTGHVGVTEFKRKCLHLSTQNHTGTLPLIPLSYTSYFSLSLPLSLLSLSPSLSSLPLSLSSLSPSLPLSPLLSLLSLPLSPLFLSLLSLLSLALLSLSPSSLH